MLDLLRKYDRPGPRYTSYPTAVEFSPAFGETAYREQLALASRASGEPLSLYLHLPFCEERCSFCGCMVIITKKRDVAAHYLRYLEREIGMLGEALGPRRRIVQYHWGGGTPTYLAPAQMRALQAAVTRSFEIQDGAELAVEVDPRVTSCEHLETLRELGFNRLSLGVQDFTPEVQRAVNRVQGEAETRALVEHARRLGFESINVDLIYGLPFQTAESFAQSVRAVLCIRPERAAVYSYAHVPWIRGNQRRIRPEDLPTGERKLGLFLEARALFLAAGYRQIGMDHFALEQDELARAAAARALHRNFMGYTTRPASDMLGAGVSAIGDVRGAFAQNTKKLSTYYQMLDAGRFPIERGRRLDADDLLRRHVIQQLMCNFRVELRPLEARFRIEFVPYFEAELRELHDLAADGLVTVSDDAIEVTPSGRLLVRNVCMCFDRYLRAGSTQQPVFSRTV
jgi:oxygen-independent coproporphyrinogen-3 oxidase